MKNYLYCDGCDDLIRKDSVCKFCGRCEECGSNDIEHTEDIEERDDNYERIQNLCDEKSKDGEVKE